MTTLPTELWWQILRCSVRHPALFETKWDHSPDYLLFHQGWEKPYYHHRYWSLPTNSTICQVSRTWREIGVELLYEHLLFIKGDVTGSTVMRKIVTIFEQHADRAGYGRSTKRIDIPVEALVQPYFQTFLRLLEFCHNIQIITISSGSSKQVDSRNPQRFPELFSLLQTRFSHSLRRLKFDLSISITRSFSCSLPDVPLETLQMSTWILLAADPPPAYKNVSSLSLDLSYNVYHLPPWRFPALRHLSLDRIRDVHLPGIQSFLVIHGPHLVSLRLEYLDKGTFHSVPGFLSSTTSLRCLILPIQPHLFSADSRFPSITHIGLINLGPYRSDIEATVSSPSFPGLRCIRYLNYANPLRKSEIPADEAAPVSSLTLGIIRDVRVEDQRGQLIDWD